MKKKSTEELRQEYASPTNSISNLNNEQMALKIL